MVPTEFPQRPDIYATMTPAKAVGGDLYDFFVRDDELVFCIGDVSGKGVPAYQVQTVEVEPGATIFLYTDGLSETMDADYNMFGEERIINEVDRAI